MAKRSYTSKQKASSGDNAVPAVSFELDAVEFVGDGAISTMDFAEYARLAAQGVDSQNPAGMAIIADVFLGLLGEQTYQRFRAHTRSHRTDDDTLVAILRDIIQDATEAATARPTQRPSDSPNGPQTAQGTARVVSLSRATVTEVEQVPQQETETVSTPAVVSYG
ncbi:hypothetical protein [Nonomuraea sp. NPDC049646]|uniref:hypothetical protein n=1 Tax=unclassified Nonomuraea TaxID=2593643 RepID=UPI0037955B8D